MALSLENTGSNESASATTLDITLTITNANLLMVGIGYTDGSRAVSSIVWDPAGVNESLTQLIREREAVSTGYVSELWYLKSPTPGSAKVVRATVTNGPTGFGVAAAGFIDAHQTTTFGTAASADSEAGASDPVTVTATTASGEIVIDFMIATSACTADAGQTAFYDSIVSGGQLGASTQAGGDGGLMSWAKDGGGTHHWATTAVSIKPADAGGPSPGAGSLTLAGQGFGNNYTINLPDEEA